MIEWHQILQQGIKALAPKIVGAALKAASSGFQKRHPYAKIDFGNHLEYAFERCSKIKTIVNGDRPIELLINYVSPDFATHNEKKIDEYNFIESVWENRRVALIGFAGAGKSMFMRYFWISCMVNPRSKIPIFIELRKFNDIRQIDFDLFCFVTATQGSIGDVRGLFQSAIDEGQFVFVLDGFDEIKSDRKAHVEEWILGVSRTNNVVIVSGRPDLAFKSWQNFTLYNMLPMSLKQTSDLISRIDFDGIVKAKFLRELKLRLYNQHRTFASRPLLATMMLLTFNSYADMPEKMHVFYDQAFDTLFSRHDATKEAFKRERSTKYSIDTFKRYLSFFSLITYNEYRTEFSETEILERISKVGSVEGVTLEAESFLKDLLDCVCILQRDGLQIVYSHRSFQEYFTSYCLVRLSDERVSELIKKFAWRTSDTVLSMLFDMNKDLVDRAFTFPALAKYASLTSHLTEESTLEEHLGAIGVGFTLRYIEYSGRENTILFSLAPHEHDMVAVRLVAFLLYRYTTVKNESIDRIDRGLYHPREDYQSFRKAILPSARKYKLGTYFVISYRYNSATIYFTNQNNVGDIIMSETELVGIRSWLASAKLRKTFWREHCDLMKLHKSLTANQERKTRTLDDILGQVAME